MKKFITLFSVFAYGFLSVFNTIADDQPQWGQKFTRNMVSSETNLVDDFDVESGENVKWVTPLGSQTWSSPIVTNGRVFIGTNNDSPRDPRHQGDRGVLMCFNEEDGSLLWQLVVPKLGPDPYFDWPRAGIPSPVTVDGGRVYAISNRNEVICLDSNGQSNGNDGPYKDEDYHMGLGLNETFEVTPLDADIIWIYDIPKQAGTYPHDSAHASILLDGDFLYINTSNGVDNTHKKIRRPNAPSLIVLHKKTGRLLAQDKENIGPRIFHSTWSSPALGVVNEQKLIFFAGGDGVVYAFEALDSVPPEGEVESLKRVWRFDCDPNAPKENVHKYNRNREEGPSNIKGMPVFYNNRIYVAVGGDIWWGKNKAWLKCFDATKKGDITETGLIWSHEVNEHCCTTPAIQDGMVFIADCDGILHCLDADTGKAFWTHDCEGTIWASPMVADGKVYIGTKRRDFFVFEANRQKKIISENRMDSPIGGTATAANGVLYVATLRNLYALQENGGK